jgi:hypothetical protein
MNPPSTPRQPGDRPASTPATDLVLGGWRMYPTPILTRHRQRIAQQCLLTPPEGFQGRARLAVIAEGRREEFSHAWLSGAREPLAFGVACDPESPAPIRADLLLEFGESGLAAGEQRRLSGSLTLRRPPLGVQIYLAPWMAPPEIGIEGRGAPAESGADSDLRRLRRARQALEKQSALRAAWPEAWSAHIVSLGWQAQIRELCGRGRLELLSGSACEPPTRAALALANRAQTLMLPAGTTAWPDDGEIPPGTRHFLLPEESLAQGTDDDADEGGGAPRPFRLSLAGRWFLAHAYARDAVAATIAEPDAPAALLWFDRVIRGALQWRSRPRDRAPARTRPAAAPAPPVTRILGFSPLEVTGADQWAMIAGYARRWNKGHLSPQLIPATPADYFATVEALEERGHVRLAQALG